MAKRKVLFHKAYLRHVEEDPTGLNNAIATLEVPDTKVKLLSIYQDVVWSIYPALEQTITRKQERPYEVRI